MTEIIGKLMRPKRTTVVALRWDRHAPLCSLPTSQSDDALRDDDA